MEESGGKLILLAVAAVAILTLAASIHAQRERIHVSRYDEARAYCPGAASCDGDAPRLVDGRYCHPLRTGSAVDTSIAICDIPAR